MDCCTNAIGKLFEGEGSIASITTRGGICTKYAEAKVGENCNGQATRITHFVSELIAFGLWPGDACRAQHCPLAASIDIVRGIGRSHLNDTPRCESWQDCDCCGLEWSLVIEGLVEDFERKESYGLCLTCLKAAKEDARDKDLAERCSKHQVVGEGGEQ